MSAKRELERLAERKLLLQARIRVRRLECVVAGQQLAPPIRLADHALAIWRKISPLVKAIAVPLGIFAASKFSKTKTSDAGSSGSGVFGRSGGAGKSRFSTLLTALPIAMEAWKIFRELRPRGKENTSASSDETAWGQTTPSPTQAE